MACREQETSTLSAFQVELQECNYALLLTLCCTPMREGEKQSLSHAHARRQSNEPPSSLLERPCSKSTRGMRRVLHLKHPIWKVAGSPARVTL